MDQASQRRRVEQLVVPDPVIQSHIVTLISGRTATPGPVRGCRRSYAVRHLSGKSLDILAGECWKLHQQFSDDASLDVGEAEIPAGVAVGEAFVIQSKEVQDRRVQVVDVDLVLGG